jgi:hypothetical protein
MSSTTLRWEDEDNRPTTALGKISIEAIVPEATVMLVFFFPRMSLTELQGLPMTLSSPRGRQPTSCPSRDGSRRTDRF